MQKCETSYNELENSNELEPRSPPNELSALEWVDSCLKAPNQTAVILIGANGDCK
jgi:hypothetical protein